MATVTLRLAEAPDIPAMFTIGDKVAWRQADGSGHAEFRGTVIDGEVTFTPARGTRSASYWVKRGDGRIFAARELDLVLLEHAKAK
jgi:hypothetical protein